MSYEGGETVEYAYAMFSRLFSVLTGTSLSEYLRERRLTEAAALRDLRLNYRHRHQ